MRPPPKSRLDTSGAGSPALNNLAGAFAGVAVNALPAGDVAGPTAAATPPTLWKPGRVVLRRERAHRGGKTVIIIDNFATHLPAPFIEDVARRVRAACGCGGAVKGRTVEIQGDQAGKVRAVLEAGGFEVAGVR